MCKQVSAAWLPDITLHISSWMHCFAQDPKWFDLAQVVLVKNCNQHLGSLLFQHGCECDTAPAFPPELRIPKMRTLADISDGDDGCSSVSKFVWYASATHGSILVDDKGVQPVWPCTS